MFSTLKLIVFALASMAFLTACGTKPLKTVEDSQLEADFGDGLEPRPKPTREKETRKQPLNIDYVGLHRSLNLERNSENLGYREKSFATCQVGYGYPANSDCRQEYFISVYFRLVCRDSEDTISTPLTEQDLFPLSGRSVRWNLGKGSGDLELDSDGYGQILAVAPVSQKAQRLKLTADQNFLFLTANTITRVVTPKNWCNSQ